MTGQLVLCATPIGNLGDVTLRLLDTLRTADAVYAEDTRRTLKLLNAHGIRASVHSCHEHNEARKAAEIVRRVAAGQTVALCTDAGMPLISDPGQKVVQAVVEAGLPVTVCPGPSAPLAALALSGFRPLPFACLGFPPRRRGERVRFLEAWKGCGATLVLFESPARLPALLADVASVFGGDHPVAVARELTKRFEEVTRTSASDAAARWSKGQVKGECTLVIGPWTDA